MSNLRKQLTSLVLLVAFATPAILGDGLHLLSDSHDHSQCGISVSASNDSCGHGHSCCASESTTAETHQTAGSEPSFRTRCQICDFLSIAQLRAETVQADLDFDKVCSRQLPPLDAPFVERVDGTLLARGPPSLA